MSKLSVTQARDELAEVVNRVHYQGERIILERRGKAVAALVSIKDLKRLEEIEDLLDIDAAKKALKERRKSIPYKMVRKKLGL